MVVLVVEKLRLYAYANFWFVIFLGIFLTKSFAGLDEDDTLLTQVPVHVSMCDIVSCTKKACASNGFI